MNLNKKCKGMLLFLILSLLIPTTITAEEIPAKIDNNKSVESINSLTNESKDDADSQDLEIGDELNPGAVGGGSGGSVGGGLNLPPDNQIYPAIPLKLLKISKSSKDKVDSFKILPNETDLDLTAKDEKDNIRKHLEDQKIKYNPMQVAFKISKINEGGKTVESHIARTNENGILDNVYLENIKSRYDFWYRKDKSGFGVSGFPQRMEDVTDKDWPAVKSFKQNKENVSNPGVNIGSYGPGSPNINRDEKFNKNDEFKDPSVKNYDLLGLNKDDMVKFGASNGGYLNVTIEYISMNKNSDEDPMDPSRPPRFLQEKDYKVVKTDYKKYDINFKEFDYSKCRNVLQNFALKRTATINKENPEVLSYIITLELVRSTPATYCIEELRTSCTEDLKKYTNFNHNLKKIYLKVDEDGSIKAGESIDEIKTPILPSIEERFKKRNDKIKELENKIKDLDKENAKIEKKLGKLIKLSNQDSNDSFFVTFTKNKYTSDNDFDALRYMPMMRMPIMLVGDCDESKSKTFASANELIAYLDGVKDEYFRADINSLISGLKNPETYKDTALPKKDRSELMRVYRNTPYKYENLDKTFKNQFEALIYKENEQSDNNSKLNELIPELELLKNGLPKRISAKTKEEIDKINNKISEIDKKQHLYFLDIDYERLCNDSNGDYDTFINKLKSMSGFKVLKYKEAPSLLRLDSEPYGPHHGGGGSMIVPPPLVGNAGRDDDSALVCWLNEQGYYKDMAKKYGEIESSLTFRSYDELLKWVKDNNMCDLSGQKWELIPQISQQVLLEKRIAQVPIMTLLNDEFIFKTYASASKDSKVKLIKKGKETVFNDRITFDKLNVGSKYKFKGKLIYKKTGKEVPTKDPIVYEITKLKKEDLKKPVDIKITFDSGKYSSGDEFVLTYDIYEDDFLVGEERDLKNKDQTVKLVDDEVPTPPTPKEEAPPTPEKKSPHKSPITGDDGIELNIILLALGLMGLTVLRKKNS